MWWVAVLGWRPSVVPAHAVTTYRVDPSFCDSVLPYFREDTLLSWRTTTCGSVHEAIRRSFDAWQINSAGVVVREVLGDADVTIGVTDGAEGFVAVATRYANLSLIQMTADTCWYTDTDFCHAVYRDRTILHTLLVWVWSLSIVAILLIVCRPAAPVRSVSRLLAWSVFLAIPLAYVGTIHPCLYCHNFVAVMMHEFGHVLGYDHSDDPNQLCGCGSNVTACNGTSVNPADAVMYSVSQRRSSTCLSRDDADGVRTLYGGSCTDPVWCYETDDPSGYSRLAVALVYSLLLSSAVVGLRNFCSRPRSLPLSPPRRRARPVMVRSGRI